MWLKKYNSLLTLLVNEDCLFSALIYKRKIFNEQTICSSDDVALINNKIYNYSLIAYRLQAVLSKKNVKEAIAFALPAHKEYLINSLPQDDTSWYENGYAWAYNCINAIHPRYYVFGIESSLIFQYRLLANLIGIPCITITSLQNSLLCAVQQRSHHEIAQCTTMEDLQKVTKDNSMFNTLIYYGLSLVSTL